MTESASSPEAWPPRRRYLSLWFPFLPAERLKRRDAGSAPPAGRPLVLVEKIDGALRLFATDRRAAGLGLEPGLTLADARARFPSLLTVEADAQADAGFLTRLAALCERFTPLTALDPPDGLTLDITGCAQLFGGEEALRAEACARLQRLGLTLRASIAGTPDAARALARYGQTAVAPPGMDESLVRPLPAAALGIGAEAAIALARAGLTTIGDLADRPSILFAARFGQELPRRLARTLGREDRRITPLRPPPDCLAERPFAEPLTEAAAVEGVLARLAGEIARLLERRGAGGRLFEASFFRSDGGVRHIAVGTGRPTRDPAVIRRLFRERIDALADPLDPGFGFDLVRLAASALEPLGPLQPELDGQGATAATVAELVDRLSARFGPERVLRFVARDTHDPDREAHAVAAAGPAPALPWPRPEPAGPPPRPLQLFEPPQPIETLAELPDGPPLRFRWRRVLHEVALAEGPERIAPEWWRGRAETAPRDYYRIEDSEGRRFWLFRRGLYGEEAGPRWFLHGLFA